MIEPRKIRQLPVAAEVNDNDILPISQMDNGSAVTRGVTYAELVERVTDAVAIARADLVNEFAARDQMLAEQQTMLQQAIERNDDVDASMQAALTMLQQIVNGESGKTPYDLWLEAGNTGTMEDYLASLKGPQGPIGPQGERGPQGDKGDKGDRGYDGIQGPTGAKGDAGAKGDQGERGPVGQTGSTGATGPIGAKGDTGAAGPKGDQGDAGATFVGTITVAQTAVVAISLGPRNIDIPMTGLSTSANYLVIPTSPVPAGYQIQTVATATSTTNLRVTVYAPLLAIGASFSIPCRVVRINT